MADQRVAFIFPEGKSDESVEISTHGNYVEMDSQSYGESVSLMLSASVARRIAYSLLAAAEIVIAGCRAYVPVEPPCVMIVVDSSAAHAHLAPCPVKK